MVATRFRAFFVPTMDEQLSLFVRLTSLRIWKRRFVLYRIWFENLVGYVLRAGAKRFRVGVVGDFVHFQGSKLEKARHFKVSSLAIVFEPYVNDQLYDRVLIWEPFGRIEPSERTQAGINARMGKINKAALDELQQKVFGNSLVIDPMTYAEPFLEKDGGTSEGGGHTANHTPLIVHTKPLEQIKSDSIYVRLIDNFNDGGYVDYRLYVCNGNVQMQCCRYVLVRRFATQSAGSLTKKIDRLSRFFSDEEIEKIKTYVSALKLDYGELDVLRDNSSNNLFIVDVNNTPYGDFRKVGFSRRAISAMYREVFFT